jgi:hypothetical protein
MYKKLWKGYSKPDPEAEKKEEYNKNRVAVVNR